MEDNEALRRVVVRQLRELGYSVVEADNAAAALEILEREPVDVVFSDVMMPGGTTGFDLARIARVRFPATRIVLTSGFAEVNLNQGDAPVEARLLSKPYRKDDLARAMREALDG